jgi:hypothetical protein
MRWANPTLRFPITQKLAQSLKYLRALLSSTGWEDWRIKKLKLAGPEGIDPSIAPRWRNIFLSAWVTLPDRPSPLALSRASRQPTIEEALRNVPPTPAQPTTRAGTRIALHFKKRRKKGLNTPNLPSGNKLRPRNLAGAVTPRAIMRPFSESWHAPTLERSNTSDATHTSKNS